VPLAAILCGVLASYLLLLLVLLAVRSYTGAIFLFKCVFLLPSCCLPTQATKPCGFLILLAVRSYTGVALF
jgi:hypothetical protein